MLLTSRKNPAVSHLRALSRDKSERDSSGEFIIEGVKLTQEALKNNLEITGIYSLPEVLEKHSEIEKTAGEKNIPVFGISGEISQYIADTKTPQGIFVAAKALDKSDIFAKIEKRGRRLVLLDCLQDAGNVGSIIRTAEAMGFDGVIAGNGSADMYSPKVIRGSMGSLFRLPSVSMELTQVIPRLIASGFTVFASMLDNRAEKLSDVKFPQKAALVIGNEGNGISPEISSLCQKRIYIPIKGAESLNAAAAAAILCWQMRI